MTPPSSRPLCALLLTALCCCTVLGFNVDVKNCIRYRGPEGSMFGFSVAQHKERGRSWLLIGAPEAQTDQPGVEKGGAVFKCGTTREDDCEEIPFDTRGNNNSSRLIQIDSKSRQWFGATVRSSGDNGVVLACAPRYVYFSPNGNRKDPVGTCYVTKDFNDFSEYSPCRTRNWGHHKQGTCQAGLGASVSRDGKRLFIGAVGSWYWQGQLYSINSSARLPYLPAIQYIIDDIDEGQFYSQNLYSRPEVLATNEGPPSDDDSYLGYSVAVGAFGHGSESGAAVGMPRGAGLLGKVVIYSTNLTNFYNITGDQLGAYFGYSICVSDVDGDGGDDIIVGAPLFSEFTKNDGSYETGRVYVFLKKDGYRFYERNTRIGFNSKSRFGLALADLGDINRDGYGDFAVGAPYDGPNELGAVYIYHGTKTGIREKYSQLIRSEDVSGTRRPISTFGFSLSGGTDLDNNLYPDLIVGAYESDVAYFMKSRPVAQMTTSVFFKSDNKQISLERKDCTTKDGTWVPCLFLSTCLQYTGTGVDDQLNIEIQLVLDAKKPKSPRMFFLLEENRNVMNHSMILEKNVQSCKTFNVYLKNNVRDKLTPLEAELRYRIIEEDRKFTRTLTPVIDLDNELFAVSRDSISIQKNCGGDNICIPNLRLIATPNSESFLLGSSEKLKVDVIVQNEGEDSFETTFDMTVPPGVNYVKIERIDNNENDIPVQCSAPSAMTNHTLHCDIGNPLPRDKYIRFNVVLEPYQTTETKARYDFQMSVNSTNPENPDSISDNSKYLGVPLWVETDLIIEGTSKPVDVHYNITMDETSSVTEEKQIGPQVIHIYGIRNKGPSDILEAEAYIDWPMFTLAGEPLLYLLEMPETSGPVRCEPIEEINPLKINVERKRKPYFESSSLVSGGSITVKGTEDVASGSSSGGATTRPKVFAELTEEEKRVFLEAQRKDEEESKSQWADGSYEKRVRYESSKSESTAIVGGGSGVGVGSGVGYSEGGANVAVNRGPTFSVSSSENGHGEYVGGSRSTATGSTVLVSGSSSRGESSMTGGGSGSSSGVVSSGGRRVEGGSSSSSSSSGVMTGSGATVQGSNTRYGSSSSSSSSSSSQGVYGAAHFDVVGGHSSGSQGASRFDGNAMSGSRGSASSSGSQYGTSSSSSGSQHGTSSSSSGSQHGTSSSSSSGSHHGSSSSSVNIESESRYGAGTQTQVHGGGSSAGYGAESSADRGGSSVVYGGESSGVRGGSAVGSTAVRGGSSVVYDESSSSSSGSLDSRGHHQSGAGGVWYSSDGTAFRSQEEQWAYENRAGAGQSWNRAGGVAGSAKNFSTFHESENSHVTNTTWDGRGPARTYVHDRWRTNDDGLIRNGSTARVVDEYAGEDEDGGLLDYRGAAKKVVTGGSAAVGGVVSSNVPGDDSDLSVNLQHQTDQRLGGQQGFKRTKIDETDTVQRWRTVDGKLYKVNKVDDWNAIVRNNDDGSPAATEVYEAQDYRSPQNYAMPPAPQPSRKGAGDATGRTDVDGKFKLYTRFKRDTQTKKCGPTRCSTVKCKIGPLSKDQEVWLAFRSRAWVSTLKKVALNRSVVLSSTISAKVTKLPYIGMPDSKLAQVRSHEVYTNVIPRDLGAKPDIIPLWLVVLAAVAGTAILLLLVYLLYKCGFFKRNRPSTAPEKQPLTHRNGQAELYQTGDEAL